MPWGSKHVAKRERKLTDEESARYRDYKQGWLDGVQRQELSSYEPRFFVEYNRGYEDGHAARTEAMHAECTRLRTE